MLCNVHKCRVYTIGLKITASQQTVSGQDDHLSWQTYSLQFILMGHIITSDEKKNIFTPLHLEEQHLFLISKYVFFC